ncbi:hypothetical protein MJ575_17630 [Klebsiella pneumoniae]|nr:hypothetical protein MJ575_17630 [Klebsiella pneumoniae]
MQIFNQETKSYRDLPLRMAEFGSCHRNEPSGALHGLMRVRGALPGMMRISSVLKDRVRDEVNACIRMVYDMYNCWLRKIVVKLSTRPEKRIGSDETRDRAGRSGGGAGENNIPI